MPAQADLNFSDDDDNYVPYVPVKKRREAQLNELMGRQKIPKHDSEEDREANVDENESDNAQPEQTIRSNVRLLDQAMALRRKQIEESELQ